MVPASGQRGAAREYLDANAAPVMLARRVRARASCLESACPDR